MNEAQMNQLIDAVKDLKTNTALEIISTIIIPVSILILTSIITLKINKRQQEFQLMQQQIALKKELKVKALSNIRVAMTNNARQFAKLELRFNDFQYKDSTAGELYESLNMVEEEFKLIQLQ